MARRSRSQQPDMLTNLFMILFRAIWSLVSLPFRRPKKVLDVAMYRAHWETLERLGRSSESEQHWRQAILEADKLVDQAFRDLGFGYDKFSDRLRAAENRFSKPVYNGLWEAHKLRNQIAHELGHQIRFDEVQQALLDFRLGLKALGAL